MVTRSDVAKRAGVSVAVVSYVLNNQDKVKASTRAKVLEAVEALGYQPNLLARSLKTKKTNQLAVLVNNLGNPFEAGILLRLEIAAREAGYAVFFQTYQEDAAAQLRQTLAGRVDGVIALGQRLPGGTVGHFRSAGIPVVSIMRSAEPMDGVPCVEIDWVGAMRTMIRHLRDAGHERIAFLAHENEAHPLHYRYEAFLEAMRLEGMAFHAADRLAASGIFETAYAALLPELGRARPYTALLCANDLMAVGALGACRDAGVGVPSELAIAGCEDILMSSQTSPAVTTIHYPREAIGTIALDMLGRLMDGASVDDVALEGTLLVRGSTTPV